MQRVLIIGVHDKIGGVETFILNYYRNLNKDKIQFDFINMYDNICFEDEIVKLGGKVHKITNVKKNPIRYYVQLKRILKENNYKVVHINMLSLANVLPILCARKSKIKKIIVHSHNSNTPKGIFRKILDKMNKLFVAKWATDLWACSNLAGQWMFGDKKHFRVINNAVDTEKFKYDENKRLEIRKKLKIEGKFVIGHVGRFSEQKNHKFLLEIFKEIIKENKQAIMLSIGEGELKQDIIKKSIDYGINERIIFLDPVSNINDYMQAMDIFILPSKFEGLPVVAVEAQANGLPVITSNNVTKELPIKELSSYCSLNNVQEWIEEIKKSNIARIDRTRDITNEKYNIKEEVLKLEKLYEEE